MRNRLLLLVLIIGTSLLAEAGLAPVTSATAVYKASVSATRVRARQSSKLAKRRTVRRAARSKAVPRSTVGFRRSRLRRIVWNPLLPGSHESQLRQNEEIDAAGYPRIENDDQLAQLIADEQLVPVNASRYLNLNSNLKDDRRTCRAATRDFLEDLGQAFYSEFHTPINVTSLVRTVEQQKKLRRRNRNAAPIDGETASSHLAGTTVDIGKRGLTKAQHAWLEHYLADLKDKNLIEPLEERRQACFHVMVFDRYQNWRDDLALSRANKSETATAGAAQR